MRKLPRERRGGCDEADGLLDEHMDDAANGGRLTDDFLPSQALYRLTEKVTTGRIA